MQFCHGREKNVLISSSWCVKAVIILKSAALGSTETVVTAPAFAKAMAR